MGNDELPVFIAKQNKIPLLKSLASRPNRIPLCKGGFRGILDFQIPLYLKTPKLSHIFSQLCRVSLKSFIVK